MKVAASQGKSLSDKDLATVYERYSQSSVAFQPYLLWKFEEKCVNSPAL